MKKLFALIVLLGSASSLCLGQTHRHHKSNASIKDTVAITAPSGVQATFNQQFTDASAVKWEKSTSGNWNATFYRDSLQVLAQYDSSGHWVSTHTIYSADRVPSSIAGDIKTKFPNASIKDATKVERDDVTAYYRVDVDDQGVSKTLLANEQGVVTE
jgi:hypothetical protein